MAVIQEQTQGQQKAAAPATAGGKSYKVEMVTQRPAVRTEQTREKRRPSSLPLTDIRDIFETPSIPPEAIQAMVTASRAQRAPKEPEPDDIPLVLKGTRKKKSAVHMREGNRHLRALGINAPETIYIDLDRTVFKKFGCYFVCEEKIDGKICYEMDNPMDFLPLAAEAFSRMHRVKRSRWGRPWDGKRFGFWGYLKRKIEEKLQRLGTCNNLFSEKHCERYWNWFMSYKDTVSRCKSFSLSHCDPHMHNVLINDDKEVYLLDNESLRYLPFSIDFFKLQYHFFLFADEIRLLNSVFQLAKVVVHQKSLSRIYFS